MRTLAICIVALVAAGIMATGGAAASHDKRNAVSLTWKLLPANSKGNLKDAHGKPLRTVTATFRVEQPIKTAMFGVGSGPKGMRPIRVHLLGAKKQPQYDGTYLIFFPSLKPVTLVFEMGFTDTMLKAGMCVIGAVTYQDNGWKRITSGPCWNMNLNG